MYPDLPPCLIPGHRPSLILASASLDSSSGTATHLSHSSAPWHYEASWEAAIPIRRQDTDNERVRQPLPPPPAATSPSGPGSSMRPPRLPSVQSERASVYTESVRRSPSPDHGSQGKSIVTSPSWVRFRILRRRMLRFSPRGCVILTLLFS